MDNQEKLKDFKKQLIIKLYKDLNELNGALFGDEKFTMEDFIYYFLNIIEENLDFDNPDYEKLLYFLNTKVIDFIKKRKENLLNLEEIEYLYNNAEWKLIDKYKHEMELLEEKNKQKVKEEKQKYYLDQLKEQIKEKESIKSQTFLKDNLKDIYNQKISINTDLEDLKEHEKNLEKNIKENFNKNYMESKSSFNNNSTIKIREDKFQESTEDLMLHTLVDKIIQQKKAENIDYLLDGIHSKAYAQRNKLNLNDLKYDTEKVDKLLKEQMDRIYYYTGHKLEK